MRVCVVGAGVSGLAAARALQSKVHLVTVFEKNAEVGGRCTTHRLGPYIFDPGATGITPRGGPLEAVLLHELDTSDLVQVQRPIYTHAALRVRPGDPHKNAIARYTYRTGNRTLAELLAQGLDVRLSSPVEELQKSAAGTYLALGEEFDRVVLTAPVPQTSTLLWTLGESRPFANAKYRPCLSVMIGFDKPTPELPYHALLDPEQRHPLTWLCVENLKSQDRAPEGHTALVVQLSPPYSLSHFADSDDRILGDTLDYIGRLFGPGWRSPTAHAIRRWKYSQPETTALFDNVNPPGSRLVIAGDGLLAARVEGAFECGLRAAQLLDEPAAKVRRGGARR